MSDTILVPPVPPEPPSGTAVDAADFKARMDTFMAAVRGGAENLQKRAVAECFNGLVLANPVGNPSLWKRPARKGYVGGTSRRSWRIGVNGPGTGNPLQELAGAKLGDRVTITNEQPYMESLNRGHSKQAQPGWIQAVIDRVVAKLQRGGS